MNFQPTWNYSIILKDSIFTDDFNLYLYLALILALLKEFFRLSLMKLE